MNFCDDCTPRNSLGRGKEVKALNLHDDGDDDRTAVGLLAEITGDGVMHGDTHGVEVRAFFHIHLLQRRQYPLARSLEQFRAILRVQEAPREQVRPRHHFARTSVHAQGHYDRSPC
jgi:hypothetical protein